MDSLTTIRKLKEHGTEVFFEKEAIWTFDSKGEMLLTILSSLSQEESRSISENVRWGQRKKFSDGRFSMPYSSFLGYDRGPDGTMVINEKQAELVRRIFRMYLQGYSPREIARILTEEGIKTIRGRDVWNPSSITGVLQNEKYKGDALLQKTYTRDFLSKKRRTNRGEVQQYYVKGSHPAIIPEETFALVQDEMERRRRGSASGISVFSSKIFCGECGAVFGSKVWHSNDKYRRVIWQCNAKFKDKKRCKTPHLSEDELKAAFLRVVNRVAADRDEILANLRLVQETIGETEELDADEVRMTQELTVVTGLVEEAIARNARIAQNQETYQQEFEELTRRYEDTRTRLEAVREKAHGKKSRARRIGMFIAAIENLPCEVKEFNDVTWTYMVDHVTVYAKNDIRFILNSGAEIRA